MSLLPRRDPSLKMDIDEDSPTQPKLQSIHPPNLAYSYRVPTPPRIVVPPPSLNANALPEFNLSTIQNQSFLKNISYNHLVETNGYVEWSYERRREAQMVLPYIYLGPLVSAKDRTFLRREKITMLLGIRQRHSFESKLMNGALRVADELGIPYSTIDLADYQELIAAFPRVTADITAHMRQVHQKYQLQQTYSGLNTSATEQELPSMGKVLVFCESGNERAAGVVAAYLMEMHSDVDYVKAMQLVQAQRFCVNFDDGMKRLLQCYWDILQARRMCEDAHKTVGWQVPVGGAAYKRGGSKRGLERDEEDMAVDSEMAGVGSQGADDRDRFDGRQFVPFVDP